MTSARALLSLSVLLLVVAGMVGDPAAGVVAAGLASLAALPAVLAGKRALRATGVLLALASLAAAFALGPAVADGQRAYRHRASRASEAR